MAAGLGGQRGVFQQLLLGFALAVMQLGQRKQRFRLQRPVAERARRIHDRLRLRLRRHEPAGIARRVHRAQAPLERFELRSHRGIYEQAKVRVINLGNVRAGISHQFKFVAQDRHTRAHEIVPIKIGPGGFL